MRRRVQYYETDRMGITHHSNYIRWFEEARIDFLREMGWGYDKLEEMGIMIPVTLVECKYKKSTTFADEVEIIVEIEKFQGVRLCLNYQIKNDKEEVVCTGRSEHCFLNPQGKVLRLEREYPKFYQDLKKLEKEE